MISLNMEGDTTGSQSLGKRGSVPLSTTFLSNIQRLKDSLGGSIPGAAQEKGLINTTKRCPGVLPNEFNQQCHRVQPSQKRDHKDKTDANQKEKLHRTAELIRPIRGAQQKLTFSLLAELTIMLPQLENELGSKQLHLGVWRKHFRWCSLLNHRICLNIQVPIYSMAETNVIRMARSLANYQMLLLKMPPGAV